MKVDYYKLLKQLDKKATSRKDCPQCNENTWILADVVFESREYLFKGRFISGSQSVAPTIVLACVNCGFMREHNGIILGVFEKDGSLNREFAVEEEVVEPNDAPAAPQDSPGKSPPAEDEKIKSKRPES